MQKSLLNFCCKAAEKYSEFVTIQEAKERLGVTEDVFYQNKFRYKKAGQYNKIECLFKKKEFVDVGRIEYIREFINKQINTMHEIYFELIEAGFTDGKLARHFCKKFADKHGGYVSWFMYFSKDMWKELHCNGMIFAIPKRDLLFITEGRKLLKEKRGKK